MDATCRRALALGIPAVAFTEHADFTPWRPFDEAQLVETPGERAITSSTAGGSLDIRGYWEELERCRAAFPGLRIMSGVELGEPHRFVTAAADILAVSQLDRVLGSVHCVPHGNDLVDVSTRGFLGAAPGPEARVREYFAEALALVESAPVFSVLAHLTYPQRYWPANGPSWSAEVFEEEIRAVLAAAARAGLALECNTTRGMAAGRGLCPSAAVFRWWAEAGGRAACVGSDAHDPSAVAAGFGEASQMLEGAGFSPPSDPTDYWLR